MFASMEYLLCGLPIISIRSLGGRDVFFDEEYVQIVDATPDAVNNGVLEISRRQIPPQHVRQKTLAKIAEHRARLIDLVAEISAAEGVKIHRDEAYKRIFSDEILQLRELHRLVAAL
jgi:hypothetical protein